MFRGLMNFSHRRTPRQAIGWFLAFFLIGVILGAIALFVARLTDIDDSVASQTVQVTGVVFTAVLGAALLWDRPKSAANVLHVGLGIFLAVRLGLMFGLMPLTALTIRPSNISPEVTKVFE
jgi:hypothetical protein